MCQPFQHQRACAACACLGGERFERVVTILFTIAKIYAILMPAN